jgi:hypothetical protein
MLTSDLFPWVGMATKIITKVVANRIQNKILLCYTRTNMDLSNPKLYMHVSLGHLCTSIFVINPEKIIIVKVDFEKNI